MRTFLSLLILGSLFFVKPNRLRIADLEPVQTVAVYLDAGAVVLETDTGDLGTGATPAEALTDMKAHSPTVIYLDTAQFLLVGDGAEAHAEALRNHLHGSVRVASYNGGDLADEAKYADLHNKLPRLRDWKGVP